MYRRQWLKGDPPSQNRSFHRSRISQAQGRDFGCGVRTHQRRRQRHRVLIQQDKAVAHGVTGDVSLRTAAPAQQAGKLPCPAAKRRCGSELDDFSTDQRFVSPGHQLIGRRIGQSEVGAHQLHHQCRNAVEQQR